MMLDLSSLLRTKSKRDIVIIVFQSKHVECLSHVPTMLAYECSLITENVSFCNDAKFRNYPSSSAICCHSLKVTIVKTMVS